MARYYASSMGRFLSPDWSAKAEPVPYAKLDDPQTLNLYAYVRNNPLTNLDKDGHCYPVCTALMGAGLGALAETASELANHQKLSSGKILAAAVGGGVLGARAQRICDPQFPASVVRHSYSRVCRCVGKLVRHEPR